MKWELSGQRLSDEGTNEMSQMTDISRLPPSHVDCLIIL